MTASAAEDQRFDAVMGSGRGRGGRESRPPFDDPPRDQGCWCWCPRCKTQFGGMNGYDCPFCENEAQVKLIDFAGFGDRRDEQPDWSQYPEADRPPPGQ